MCLDYGTPHRFRLAQSGADLPLECHDRDTLLSLLRQELKAGVYHQENLYHPLLALGLEGLIQQPAALHPIYQEPDFPFCDVIQALALVFGFASGSTWVPDRQSQQCWLVWGHGCIFAKTNELAWHVLTICVTADQLEPWHWATETLARRGGFGTLIFRGLLDMERESGTQMMFVQQATPEIPQAAHV